MATDLTTTAGDIIDAAARKLHIVESGASVTNNQQTDALETLNFIVKELDSAPGLAFKRDSDKKTVAISAGGKSINCGAGVLAVQAVQYLNGTTDAAVPLAPMSRTEYVDAANDKVTPSQGTPSHYYVTNNDGTRKIYIFPTPDTNGSIEYWSRDKLDLFDNTSDTSDLPDAFMRYLVWQLAADMAPEFGKGLETLQYLEKKAQEALQRASADQTEILRRQVAPEELDPETR